MLMDEILILVSWASPDDPAQEEFRFRKEKKQYVIREEKSIYHWKSRVSDVSVEASSEYECKEELLKDCNCQAYSFKMPENSQLRGVVTLNPTCWIWSEDLNNIQFNDTDGGREIHLRVQPNIGADSITLGDLIRDNEGETLVSLGKTFKLGFFTPNGSSDHRRYVGIWYYGSQTETVVWVANRDSPLLDDSGVFATTEDGNLKVLDGNVGELIGPRILEIRLL
ncbi:hypothetical protein Q3G72_020392 [Acer saccharum]|nr:hypothetical protein Q3G72_020392 [Acer saccharum]